MVYLLSAALMITMPILLGKLIAARRKASWGLFGIGAVTFTASQIGHIPFNWLALQRLHWVPLAGASDTTALVQLSLFLGLSAGVFEEIARYGAFRLWAKDARSWGRGLMLGAGHGGIESIILGILLAINIYFMARIRGGALLHLVPEGQLPMVQTQIEAMFSAPWSLVILGALERLFALCFHLSASLLVMQAVMRRQPLWLGASILWHTLLNAVAVFAASRWSPYAAEGIVGMFALISLGIVFLLRESEPSEVDLLTPDTIPLLRAATERSAEFEVTEEILERSRYTG